MPSDSPIDPKPRRWRRALAILLFVAACATTLVVGFFLVEKQRGRAAWEGYEAEAKARGVKMMLADYVPPPVPDAENFAAIPLFEEIFRAGAAGRSVPGPLALPQVEKLKQPAFDSIAKQQRIDLAAWQAYFVETKMLPSAGGDAAADVLTALRRYDEPLGQLREAGTRPACRFPVRYEDGINAALPHLGSLQMAAKLYSLRLAAHLAGGQRGEALQDFRDGLRLYTATAQEPTLIAGLVRMAVLDLVANAVWGGLAGGRWGDAELREIEAACAPLRLFADYQLGMGSERGFGNSIYAQMHGQSSREIAKLFSGIQIQDGNAGNDYAATAAAFSLYPRGWLYRSQVRSNRYIDEMLARVTVDPPRVAATQPGRHDFKPTSRYDRMRHMLYYLLAPALETVERRYAAAQTLMDQTRLACALERHRLARGSFPEKLEALAPEFIAVLPRDVMTGEPLHYRLLDGGQRFSLYSVAMNLEDDGGGTGGGKLFAADRLDWVWRYPER